MKKSDFSKCHGWKIVLVVIMIIVNLLGFVFIHWQKNDYSVVYPYSAEVSYNASIIAGWLMFIPPIIFIIHIVIHRKAEYKGYGSDAADAAVAAVIIFAVTVLYVITWFLVHSAAMFIVPMLFPKVG